MHIAHKKRAYRMDERMNAIKMYAKTETICPKIGRGSCNCFVFSANTITSRSRSSHNAMRTPFSFRHRTHEKNAHKNIRKVKTKCEICADTRNRRHLNLIHNSVSFVYDVDDVLSILLTGSSVSLRFSYY